MKEIEILGAGISGLTAAIALSKSFKVKVYEKRKHLNDKGYHISAIRNYQQEDFLQKISKMGLHLNPSNEVHRALRYSPSGFLSETSSSKPLFYVFDRGKKRNSLEHQLLHQALNNGVEIVLGSNKGKAQIIATGPKRADIFAYGKIYQGKMNAIYLFYDNNYAPQGYLCIIPSQDRFQILAVSFDKSKFSTLQRRFENAVSTNKSLKNITKNRSVLSEVTGYGNYFGHIGYNDGMYYVGEAGGFQDASRGFGIWYAILTGYLVAQCIVEKSDYNKKIQEILLDEYMDNLKRREKFNNLNNEDLDALIRKMGGHVNLEEYLRRRI